MELNSGQECMTLRFVAIVSTTDIKIIYKNEVLFIILLFKIHRANGILTFFTNTRLPMRQPYDGNLFQNILKGYIYVICILFT